MKLVERRIKEVEERLNIGTGRQRLLIVLRRAGDKQLPEPVEEWVTYKEARPGPLCVFLANPDKEFEARETLRNAAVGARS